MKKYSLYRDGDWVEPSIDDYIEVENPATKEIIAQVPAAQELDVKLAIRGAKKAFPNWKATEMKKRVEYLEKMYDYLVDNKKDMAETIHKELGAPKDFALKTHVEAYLPHIKDYFRLAEEFEEIEKYDGYEVHKEPVGVVGCLTPWNYPFGQIIKKVFPALVAGNTVVLKPSQNTPLTAYYVIEAAHEAKLPAGVLQLVTGRGSEVGDVMTNSDDVNMISFTGSTDGGSQIYKQSAETVKKIALELGGKSPAVILEGADYEEAVKSVLSSVYMNTGQSCSAKTRLVAPKKDKEKLEEMLIKHSKEYKFGDPTKGETQVGPLQSKKQYEKVNGLVEYGKSEATLLYQGEKPEGEGYFFPPTIFTDVDQNAKIAQEEIFGPVLSVIYYEDEDQAIEIANNTIYGLSGMVYGPEDDAREFAKKIRAGQIIINGASTTHNAPFGGYKYSGIGREGSIYGLEEYVELKSVFI